MPARLHVLEAWNVIILGQLLVLEMLLSDPFLRCRLTFSSWSMGASVSGAVYNMDRGKGAYPCHLRQRERD